MGGLGAGGVGGVGKLDELFASGVPKPIRLLPEISARLRVFPVFLLLNWIYTGRARMTGASGARQRAN